MPTKWTHLTAHFTIGESIREATKASVVKSLWNLTQASIWDEVEVSAWDFLFFLNLELDYGDT